MEKKFTAAIVPGVLAFAGIELASLFNITSTAGRVIAGLVGAVAGVLLAGEL